MSWREKGFKFWKPKYSPHSCLLRPARTQAKNHPFSALFFKNFDSNFKFNQGKDLKSNYPLESKLKINSNKVYKWIVQGGISSTKEEVWKVQSRNLQHDFLGKFYDLSNEKYSCLSKLMFGRNLFDCMQGLIMLR